MQKSTHVSRVPASYNMPKEKGQVYLYTGNGKGKTTAALGTAMRALGWGWKVRMIQFIKTGSTFGEYKTVKEFGDRMTLESIGQGFYKILNDKKPEEVHKKTAQIAWQKTKKEIEKGEADLVVIDELNNAIEYGFINVDEVIKTLQERPRHVSVVITGRGAHPKIVEIADLVTEMKEIKHPYQKGLTAKKGLDY